MEVPVFSVKSETEKFQVKENKGLQFQATILKKFYERIANLDRKIKASFFHSAESPQLAVVIIPNSITNYQDNTTPLNFVFTVRCLTSATSMTEATKDIGTALHIIVAVIDSLKLKYSFAYKIATVYVSEIETATTISITKQYG